MLFAGRLRQSDVFIADGRAGPTDLRMTRKDQGPIPWIPLTVQRPCFWTLLPALTEMFAI